MILNEICEFLKIFRLEWLEKTIVRFSIFYVISKFEKRKNSFKLLHERSKFDFLNQYHFHQFLNMNQS